MCLTFLGAESRRPIRRGRALLEDVVTKRTFAPESLDSPAGRGDVRLRDVSHGLRAAIPHHELQFALKNFQHAIDAGLAERAEAPQEWPADADRLRAERQRLEDIGAAADTAVDEHGNSAAHFGDD